MKGLEFLIITTSIRPTQMTQHFLKRSKIN